MYHNSDGVSWYNGLIKPSFMAHGRAGRVFKMANHRLKLRSLSKVWWVLRRRRNRKFLATGLIAAGLAITVSAMVESAPTKVNPTAYVPLLNVIADGESSGNYNAHFGNAANATVRFTDMSVGEVLRWQEEYVRQGSPSSAVGRYQIIRPTLTKLVQEQHIEPSARFDEKLQDRMAIALLERRGSLAYVEKKISREQFAANLAQEWAALPRVTGPNPTESYYAGDGLNKSRISVDAVYKALDALIK